MNTTSAADHLPKYGFSGRLRSEFPSQVIMDATELCNLACVHCPHPQFKKSEHYQGRNLDGGLVRKAIDEVAAAGKGIVQYVRFTGEGEPLIRKDIFELLSYSVKNSGTAVTLTTNGTLLNQQNIDALLATQLSLVDISIDAFNEDTYSSIRVNGQLPVTRANVLSLLKRARETKSSTKIVVSYVEQPRNAPETKDFETFWKAEGADYVVIRRLHSNAGAVVQIAKSIQEQTERQRRPCLYPWERVLINPRGEIVFCAQDWVHGSVVADLRNHTIHEVWSSEFYQQLRKAHLTNDFSKHAFCGACPDWAQTRWPDEGRSYANMVEEFKAKE